MYFVTILYNPALLEPVKVYSHDDYVHTVYYNSYCITTLSYHVLDCKKMLRKFTIGNHVDEKRWHGHVGIKERVDQTHDKQTLLA